jgi:hypothetical protein
LSTADEYLRRASSLRDKAQIMDDESIRDQLVEIAVFYEEMAGEIRALSAARDTGGAGDGER